MESRPPRRWAPPAASWGPWLLGLLLFPWTLQLTGGQSVTHSGDPILVSLANKAVSFNCKITYSYTPEFKDFTVWYFHVDLKSQRSLNKQVNCPPTQGKENQTYTLQCQVTLKLPNASATGTYYCCVNWPNVHRISDGVFILVRGEASAGLLPGLRAQSFLTVAFGAQNLKMGNVCLICQLWQNRTLSSGAAGGAGVPTSTLIWEGQRPGIQICVWPPLAGA
uniref:NFAM1 Ig-like domain-containing protein n=1 Tax=Canis lupus familiaris TaxID=9615 RepID=A0A8C0SM73_CANLF